MIKSILAGSLLLLGLGCSTASSVDTEVAQSLYAHVEGRVTAGAAMGILSPEEKTAAASLKVQAATLFIKYADDRIPADEGVMVINAVAALHDKVVQADVFVASLPDIVLISKAERVAAYLRSTVLLKKLFSTYRDTLK